MKKFTWTVEISIDETWVEDGFNLDEATMRDALSYLLPYAYGHELGAKIAKAPPVEAILRVQGYTESKNQ